MFCNIHANTSLLEGGKKGIGWGVVAAGYTALLNVEQFPLSKPSIKLAAVPYMSLQM